MKKMVSLLLAVAIVFSLNPALATTEVKAAEKREDICLSPAFVKLKGDMEKAWIDHTIWTRSYIVSAISDRPDQQYVLERLLRNQQDIGNIIKPFYGEAAGNKLAELLTEHIEIAGHIVAAAKAGNQAEVKKQQTQWHRNADDIAKFLSDANPNWPFKEMQDMLYTHLQLITEIVLACLNGDWQRDIEATDQNEIHMLHLANILAEGIYKQFPEKF